MMGVFPVVKPAHESTATRALTGAVATTFNCAAETNT